MGSDETLRDEVTRLRAEVAATRQREVDDLYIQLAELRKAVEHYRGEALHHERVARDIASLSEKRATTLRAELDAMRKVKSDGLRGGNV